MDGSRINLVAEIIKLAIGISLLVHLGSWFGIDQFISAGSFIVAGYLVVSMVAAVYFSYFDRAEVVRG